MELKISKRQGGMDVWSDDKIITSMMRAGADSDEAQHVAKSVKDWSRVNANNGQINSTKLRDQIIKQLKLVNPLAANTYQLYKR